MAGHLRRNLAPSSRRHVGAGLAKLPVTTRKVRGSQEPPAVLVQVPVPVPVPESVSVSVTVLDSV